MPASVAPRSTHSLTAAHMAARGCMGPLPASGASSRGVPCSSCCCASTSAAYTWGHTTAGCLVNAMVNADDVAGHTMAYLLHGMQQQCRRSNTMRMVKQHGRIFISINRSINRTGYEASPAAQAPLRP